MNIQNLAKERVIGNIKIGTNDKSNKYKRVIKMVDISSTVLIII